MVYTQLNVKIVLFRTIQFSSIWPIDRTLSGATTPSQSGPGSDGNEGVLHIPQSLNIRLFSVISRTLVGEGVLPLCRGAVHVFYSTHSSLADWAIILTWGSTVHFIQPLKLAPTWLDTFNPISDPGGIKLQRDSIWILPRTYQKKKKKKKKKKTLIKIFLFK